MIEKGQTWAMWKNTQPVNAGGMIRRVLAYDDSMMCVENTFAEGAAAPLHSHPHVQIAYIVEGVFSFEVDGQVRTVRKGDSVYLGSDVPHACTCLEPGIVLDTFSPMRKDFI